MQVWRKLKGLGALYLQQSVCLLPDRPAVAAAVNGLRERVHTDGGADAHRARRDRRRGRAQGTRRGDDCRHRRGVCGGA
ncbi:Chromate resistance protein ChrB [Streptomyces sp. NPDC046727]|uniref:Chromate resistance protein ChrB n=1 Tax=Streptomyces sp. NPDC046727 TaxID=3155373 RepID=UPI0033E5955E